MRDIVILGSTGSIGTSALRVLARQRDRFRPVALTAHGRQAALAAPRISVKLLQRSRKTRVSETRIPATPKLVVLLRSMRIDCGTVRVRVVCLTRCGTSGPNTRKSNKLFPRTASKSSRNPHGDGGTASRPVGPTLALSTKDRPALKHAVAPKP